MKKKRLAPFIFALVLVVIAAVVVAGLTERKPDAQKIEKKIDYEAK